MNSQYARTGRATALSPVAAAVVRDRGGERVAAMSPAAWIVVLLVGTVVLGWWCTRDAFRGKDDSDER